MSPSTEQGNLVSPLLSIIEGERGRHDSPGEKTACAYKEAEAVKAFYRIARADEFLLENADKTGEIFAENREEAWPFRAQFLGFTLPLLGAGVAREKRAKL
ncbi:hypothetical protein [Polaromonas sp. AET17H-212]|uniref:hypothetical protein n=1 Tax=Polaromonas sp. AET17H-212 TaxID=1977061 RepID=UPI001144A291|nr:hypothetical protein [Polaromonas sp. AET17H-212]